MTPQELKASILNLAIQGKLTERCDEDGFASELLLNTSVANNVDGQRVKEKNITEISDDEIPFDIPETWEWVKLGTVCVIARGGSPRPIKEYITTSEDGVNWIKIGDTDKNGKYIHSTSEKIKPSGVSKSRMVHAGDFLLTNSMSFGRPYILKTDGCIHDGWLVISQINEVFYQDYLYWLLSSNYAYMQFCGKVSGAVVKNLNSDKVANSIFPLPPLAEQKRIVAKIEELLPLIDRYELAWSKLEDFNKHFPVDMQKSILKTAIQGKLVEQRPEEGTGEELFQQIQTEKQALIKAGKIKKEKALPEITEDEIPFDIPESWKWVRFGSLLHKLVDGTHRTPKYTASGVPFVSVRNMSNGTLSLQDTKFISQEEHRELWNRCNPQRGDILLSKVGTTGVPAKVETDTEFSLFVSVALLKFNNDLLDIDFLLYSILAPDFQKQCKEHTRGVGNKNWVIIDIANTMMPLPPLAEQKRIVAKLEEILPLCERLK